MTERQEEQHAEGAQAPLDRDHWPVQPESVKVWEDAFHKLHLSLDGQEFVDVRARRAFPLSEKADYVSFLDDKDKEVALLARSHELDKESRRALEKALDRMYYVARIVRVHDIRETMGVAHWKVETDRGYASFEVVEQENIRKLPHDRLIIVDVDGNRFEVEDIEQLDVRSQALIRSET